MRLPPSWRCASIPRVVVDARAEQSREQAAPRGLLHERYGGIAAAERERYGTPEAAQREILTPMQRRGWWSLRP